MSASPNLDLVRSIYRAWERARPNAVPANMELTEVSVSNVELTRRLVAAFNARDIERWREGLIVYAKSYVHKEEALRDLGVSEDELEPIEP